MFQRRQKRHRQQRKHNSLRKQTVFKQCCEIKQLVRICRRAPVISVQLTLQLHSELTIRRRHQELIPFIYLPPTCLTVHRPELDISFRTHYRMTYLAESIVRRRIRTQRAPLLDEPFHAAHLICGDCDCRHCCSVGVYSSDLERLALFRSVVEGYLRFQHRNVVAKPDHCDLSFPLDCFVKAAVFDAVRLIVNVVVVVFSHSIILSFQTRFICPQNPPESSCGVVIPPFSAGRHKPRTNARHADLPL